MTHDPFAAALAVADAVLWEGYVLYPYRASAAKNRLRWQFGVLTPRAYADADGYERWELRAECVADAPADAAVTVRARFLRAQRRCVEVLVDDEWQSVDAVERGGQRYITWDEAVACAVAPGPVALAAERWVEQVDATTRVVRGRQAVHGELTVHIEARGDRLVVRVRLRNTTPWDEYGSGRDAALARSFIAAHVLLHVDAGRFVSARECDDATSDGVFPVLVGDGSVMLASPIILDDFPAVAPTSRGDMFDATEIEQMLALRVQTLTDDEKDLARATDPRAADIVDRADPDTDTVLLGDIAVGKGSRVTLRPGAVVGRRTDAQDAFLVGRQATVAGVFGDVDGERYVAVVVDGDADFGRYRYFFPDEVEPL